jgi:hypothetical protein
MSHKTLEELLELVKKTSEERVEQKQIKKEESHPVRKFINEYPVKPGLVKVPTYVLYYTFRVLYKGSPDITKHKFFLEFKKMFKQVRNNDQRYYLLDATNLPMTREGLLEAKYYDERNSNGKRKEKKEAKIKGLPSQSGL